LSRVERLQAQVSSGGQDGADAVWRALAALLFVVLAFGCPVMVVTMADIAGTPTCDDVLTQRAELPEDRECFDGSSLQRTVAAVVGFASGAIAAVAAVLAILFAITGRRPRLTLALAAFAIALGILAIVIGSV
jgi:membrane-associated PAP2 superfamily phosphatase